MSRTARARSVLPVTEKLVYLNTAGLGPVTSVYTEKLEECNREDLRLGRAVRRRYDLIEVAKDQLRGELGRLLQCDASRISLTQSTTAGLDRVIRSLDWRPGDEAILTDLEHEACVSPLRRQAARTGIGLRIAEAPAGRLDGPGWITDLITSKTKLIAFSGVAFENGARLAIEEIAAIARARGIATLLDGAQCAGAMRLSVEEAGVDYCAIPLQKWLCGPEGLGALYVRSQSGNATAIDPRDEVIHGRGVFEAAARQLTWMRTELGWPWIFERTAALAGYARKAIRETAGASLLTPDRCAGITTVCCGAALSASAVSELALRGLIVRHLPARGAFRISTAFFNTEKEIDAFLSALSELSGPAAGGEMDNGAAGVHPASVS